ncbi:UDP-glycosyltransferase UGT5-like [Plutella xylostella]|uniref:UDP-glycosyltransferase UGT5-like n=1 Tax=Plutella xylostella TaxID=51655 RepID=UPI0020331C00|nr:UDP-glycosyltransferase UGT5-like [Plutella xylostella]
MIILYYLFASVAVSLVFPTNSARILGVFPTPSVSHQVVFRPLTQELAKRGHDLVILTTDPAFKPGETPANIREIDLHDESYRIWRTEVLNTVDGKTDDPITLIELAIKINAKLIEKQIETKEVQELIKSKTKFDLILVEACARPALIMSHVFKAPVIQVSSFMAVPPNYQVFGSPAHPILYPEWTRNKIYNLTVWEKISGAYDDLRIHYIWRRNEDFENEMIKRQFGPEAPTVAELADNVDMLFLNVHPIWEGNRAVPPNVIHMGGLPQKPHKELPEDLKQLLDNSKHGVIYMSFGTNVIPSQLPPERIQVFCKVFSRLPYDVIWKWDQDELPGRPGNVRIYKWVPQSDVLRHPNVKLFITQGGLQSTDEAISAAVPLIAFPMLGDQWYNAEKYVHHGIGLKLELEIITEEVLEDSVKTVIGDESYHTNLVHLRSLMLDQPQPPLSRAVWWAEYTLRHGGAKHLRSPAANISWAEFLMLDVLGVISAVVVVLLAKVVVVVKLVLKWKRSKVKQS